MHVNIQEMPKNIFFRVLLKKESRVCCIAVFRVCSTGDELQHIGSVRFLNSCIQSDVCEEARAVCVFLISLSLRVKGGRQSAAEGQSHTG